MNINLNNALHFNIWKHVHLIKHLHEHRTYRMDGSRHGYVGAIHMFSLWNRKACNSIVYSTSTIVMRTGLQHLIWYNEIMTINHWKILFHIISHWIHIDFTLIQNTKAIIYINRRVANVSYKWLSVNYPEK